MTYISHIEFTYHAKINLLKTVWIQLLARFMIKKNVINLQSKLMFVFSDVVIIVSRNGLAIVSISFDLTVPLNLTMFEIVFKRER